MTSAIKLHESGCPAVDSDSSGNEEMVIKAFVHITGAEPGGDNSTIVVVNYPLELFPGMFSVNFKFGTSSAATVCPESMLTVKRLM